jgi:hypothetical protein
MRKKLGEAIPLITVEFDALLGVVDDPGDGADGNRNGTVDPDDYNVWRTNFGRVFTGATSGTSAGALVPEPTTCGLVAGILALASWSRISMLRRRS